MDRAETLTILAILKAAYPAFYKDMTRKEAESVVELWGSMFDEPVAVVAAAVKALIASDEKGFPPHIGAVKARIRQITTQAEMTEQEAWALVSKAAHNGYYGAQKEFDKLPPLVQKVVGLPSQLREWSLMDESAFQSVVASNFQRSYRTIVKRNEEYQKLPGDIKALVDSVSCGMSIREIDATTKNLLEAENG